MVLRSGIEAATNAAVEGLKSMSVPVSGKQSIENVAANSAADPTIGKLISEAMEKVGKDGVITVEESKTMQTNLSLVEGHAVRPRLRFRLHGDRHRQDGGRAG